MAIVLPIRPDDGDSLRRPTMRELETARDEAKRLGHYRRALAYELLRVKRLRDAQAGKLDEEPDGRA